jgi:hypothetical protein
MAPKDLALARAEALIGNTVGGRELLPARRTLFQIDVLEPMSVHGPIVRTASRSRPSSSA